MPESKPSILRGLAATIIAFLVTFAVSLCYGSGLRQITSLIAESTGEKQETTDVPRLNNSALMTATWNFSIFLVGASASIPCFTLTRLFILSY